MSESQNIEYKSSWHNDYLDWICGLANAQGGKIYIGKDDNGNIIGVADYKELMEKIPNKFRANESRRKTRNEVFIMPSAAEIHRR
jgi:ATP-dependent DNA helicase RecG